MPAFPGHQPSEPNSQGVAPHSAGAGSPDVPRSPEPEPLAPASAGAGAVADGRPDPRCPDPDPPGAGRANIAATQNAKYGAEGEPCRVPSPPYEGASEGGFRYHCGGDPAEPPLPPKPGGFSVSPGRALPPSRRSTPPEYLARTPTRTGVRPGAGVFLRRRSRSPGEASSPQWFCTHGGGLRHSLLPIPRICPPVSAIRNAAIPSPGCGSAAAL